MKSTKKHSSFSMQETDEAEEENEDLSDRQKQIREGGAVVTKNRKHTIQCLTVIGQIEGHYVAPSQNKTTKYEHVIPQIVSVEEDPNIDGLLMILNTVGGDVEAGLAIAELVAGMRKPTVSLVLGGGHSIGVPLAVAAKHSFIAPSASMTIHPVRMSGLMLGVPQTLEYFQRMQDRITNFVTANSGISYERFMQLAMNTQELVMDVGTVLDGDEAGLKSVTIQVNGENAYGYLKSEKGIHRLVRVSPFDSAGRRQTSFASCDVMPEIEDDTEIEIKPDDIRIDTYRASGAGGQHINKTSSAIRITHFPTGVVVSCQEERSQFANKDKAFKMLRSKLLALKIEEQMQKLAEIRGDVKEIGWGSQIRSYIFMPYTLVKDHRTGEETGKVDAVMDGEIDNFISAYLAWIHS